MDRPEDEDVSDEQRASDTEWPGAPDAYTVRRLLRECARLFELERP